MSYVFPMSESALLAEMKLWDRRIQLILKPKPRWMPKRVWRWMVKTLLVQVEEKLR